MLFPEEAFYTTGTSIEYMRTAITFLKQIDEELIERRYDIAKKIEAISKEIKQKEVGR